MEFEKHSNKMQNHTTSIVLSTHKTGSITSPTLDSNVTQSPSFSSPVVEKVKHREKKKEHAKKKGESNNKRKEVTRLNRLPKEVIKVICEFLTFEELFTCTSVCRKMNRKFTRILTSYKKCSSIEKTDIKLLMDPTSFTSGVTFYRIPNSENGFCKLAMQNLREKKGDDNNNNNNKKREQIITNNSVSRNDFGQVAHHLKQLEHMLIYNTVNGNEIVRVTNSWIFFNRKLFIKISDKIVDEVSNVPEDDRLYLIDVILVEAALNRKPKSSFFGMSGSSNGETFCQITLDHLNLRTSTNSQDSDPVWNEDCSFTVKKNTTSPLQITMLQFSKLGRHTKLGTVEISLKDLACDVLHDVWQPVTSLHDDFSGKFHVMIHKSRIPKKKEIDTRTLGILGHCGPICETVPIRLEFGDLVLISNSEFYTHIAKLGTLSVWDHIAMVVERKGELHLFESSPDGVFTTPLNRRLKFYLKGSTLGVRRLTITRTPEMKQTLKKFIKEVDGRPYKQNWMDLVRAWQGSHTSEDLSSIFCSELVAAAYKRMGLLSDKIPSNNFLPVDFATPNNSKVKLINGRLEKIRTMYISGV